MLDGWLPEEALRADALHEVKPRTYRDWPAVMAFAVRLAIRRCTISLRESSTTLPILWCCSAAHAGEYGRPYAPGLEALGLCSSHLIVVEPVRAGDALWAMEEGLKSKALSLVVGIADGIDLTPSRRLGLAASVGSTPCLLLTGSAAPAAAGAHTRWRLARAPSGPHPFDPAAPGASRISLSLERCRGRAVQPEMLSQTVEWCDAARRFRVAAEMADRASRESSSRLRSG